MPKDSASDKSTNQPILIDIEETSRFSKIAATVFISLWGFLTLSVMLIRGVGFEVLAVLFPGCFFLVGFFTSAQFAVYATGIQVKTLFKDIFLRWEDIDLVEQHPYQLWIYSRHLPPQHLLIGILLFRFRRLFTVSRSHSNYRKLVNVMHRKLGQKFKGTERSSYSAMEWTFFIAVCLFLLLGFSCMMLMPIP